MMTRLGFSVLVTRLVRAFSCVALCGAFSLRALADEPSITISKERVVLSDVMVDAPEAISAIDLGKAPPPGRSRYIPYQEILLKLKRAGVPASTLRLPAGIRVFSEARQYSTTELESAVMGPIRSALPAGISLESIKVFDPKLLSPDTGVGRVFLPRFVMKKGTQSQTATVELTWGSDVVLRLPVRIQVTVSDAALEEVVKRGSNVTLCIRKGQVEVTTLAQTLANGRIGDVISVRIDVTKKVVSGKIVSIDKVELEI